MIIGTLYLAQSCMSWSSRLFDLCTIWLTANGADGLSGCARSYAASSSGIRASHSSSSSGGRALSDGNAPTTPALHCAITRSGTEMMKSGEPITGIDRRPLNRAGIDIARRSFVGKQIEGWPPYQQGNLSTVKYCVWAPMRMQLPQFQLAEFLLRHSGVCRQAQARIHRASNSAADGFRFALRAPRNDDAGSPD